MILVTIKCIGIWLLIVFAAIINGVVRELLFTPLLGAEMSLPLSGLTLSALVLVISYGTLAIFGKVKTGVYVFMGLFWLVLTLAFEYLFGHFVLGKHWQEINQVFNLMEGNLFSVVLIVTAASPWLAAKLKGLV